MSKNFRFKRFEIEQQHAGFKVGTDGCLLAAWSDFTLAQKILDIGTGSGLMAIMAAQRNPQAQIFGIEINPESAAQAKINAEHCTWSDRIEIIESSIQTFANKFAGNKFDHILCNPPFFSASTKNKSSAQTLARHDDSLPLNELLECAFSLSTEDGKLSLVLPIERETNLLEIAYKTGWFSERILRLKPLDHKAVNRIFCTFSKTKIGCNEEQFSLYITPNHYGLEATALLKDFYLKL